MADDQKMDEEKRSFRQRWFPLMRDTDVGGDHGTMDIVEFGSRWLRTLVLAGALLYGGYQGVGNNIKYSEGTRTGMINKISNKGLVWKTYEGELALEGIVSDGKASTANVWQFSIERNDPRSNELVKKINQYIESGTKVRITYQEPFATWPWRSGTDYLITDVQPVAQSK